MKQKSFRQEKAYKYLANIFCFNIIIYNPCTYIFIKWFNLFLSRLFVLLDRSSLWSLSLRYSMDGSGELLGWTTSVNGDFSGDDSDETSLDFLLFTGVFSSCLSPDRFLAFLDFSTATTIFISFSSLLFLSFYYWFFYFLIISLRTNHTFSGNWNWVKLEII